MIVPPKKRTVAQQQAFLGDVHVTLTPRAWFALVPDDPRLAGRTYTGKTLDDALATARADAQHFYRGRANVSLSIKD